MIMRESPPPTLATARERKTRDALLFHWGFFLASLPFFRFVSFTLFFTFSRLCIASLLLVSVCGVSNPPISQATPSSLTHFCVFEAWLSERRGARSLDDLRAAQLFLWPPKPHDQFSQTGKRWNIMGASYAIIVTFYLSP